MRRAVRVRRPPIRKTASASPMSSGTRPSPMPPRRMVPSPMSSATVTSLMRPGPMRRASPMSSVTPLPMAPPSRVGMPSLKGSSRVRRGSNRMVAARTNRVGRLGSSRMGPRARALPNPNRRPPRQTPRTRPSGSCRQRRSNERSFSLALTGSAGRCASQVPPPARRCCAAPQR